MGSFWKNEPNLGYILGLFHRKVGSFSENEVWESRDGNVHPTFKPRKEFGAGGPEVGIDNQRRGVTIRGAGNGTTNKGR